MSPEDDEGAARQQPRSSNILQNLDRLNGTSARRQKPPATHVLAETFPVVGGTGRHRWLLIFRCPWCGQRHVAHGRGDLPLMLDRPAACKRGRLAIHPFGEEVAA